MPEFTEVFQVEEIENGQMRSVPVRNKNVLIAKVDNQIFAASDICPHLKGRLSRGTLEGTIVTCPRHGSRFDLRDGHVVRWTDWSGFILAASKVLKTPRSLETYRVKVDQGKIMVEV